MENSPLRSNPFTDNELKERATPLINVEPIWLTVPDKVSKTKKKLNPDLVSEKQMRGVRNGS